MALQFVETSTSATIYCQDIDGNTASRAVIVGEARHWVLPGTSDDEGYVNSYWDQGGELSLRRYIGAMNDSTYQFGLFTSSHDHSALDCATVTIELEERFSNTSASQPCPSAYQVQRTPHVTDTCPSGSNYLYDTETVYCGGHNTYYRYWDARVTLDAPEAHPTSNPDTGCFELLTTGDCTIVQFPHNES